MTHDQDARSPLGSQHGDRTGRQDHIL